ncbi:Uncharacterised protein [Klebsiella pneumoniae]|uniref:Uncharacterized protein n=1 Tax=Klebsiella pneumoniae TaxID=573 RepID=A0A3S4G9G5_KLEPN|nr:Uncharacterised protein [Klebsiella pneumoniae]
MRSSTGPRLMKWNWGFTRHGAKADAERACGFDAPVVNAGEAHTAQQFAGQVDGRLAHGNSGRIINN